MLNERRREHLRTMNLAKVLRKESGK